METSTWTSSTRVVVEGIKTWKVAVENAVCYYVEVKSRGGAREANRQ